jgi:HK97 family phage portal protein
MTLFERFKAAVAVLRNKGGTVARDVALNDLLDFLGVDRSLTGEARSEAVYFACKKVLSEAVGKLPLKIQQARPGEGIRVAREHLYYRMLNERPNRHMTASVFWNLLEQCRNEDGNGYAWIDTRNPHRPQLWPLDPGRVRVYYDNACLLADAPDVWYQVATPTGDMTLGSEEVLHVKSHNTRDGLVGIPVREQLASTIQGNAKAQAYINKLYESGMTAKMVLQYTGSLSDANVQALKEGIENYGKGDLKKGLENVIPIPVGMSITPLNLKLADSQFLEIKQYTALQIASAFGVKPYQIGDYTKSSYANAEAQQLSFLVDTLLFIVKQYEEEIGYKLLSDDEEAAGYHVKFNTAVILRADQQTQINTLSAAVSNFLMTPNEARERLDLPAKEGGDQLLGNGASIPVQFTGAQYTNISAGKEEEKAWLITTIAAAVKAALA